MIVRIEIMHKDKIYVQAGYTSYTRLHPIHKRSKSSSASYHTVTNKIERTDGTAIVTLYSGCTKTNIKDIIRFIKVNRIKNVYFFIEDVFRLYSKKHQFTYLETYVLDYDQKSVRSLELDMISTIISKTKCNYKIYHCEQNADIVGENYNLEINYFDWFFLDCIDIKNSGKQRKYIESKIPIKHKISCFNLRRDWHRTIIMSLIKDFDGTFSLNDSYTTKELITNPAIPLKNFGRPISKRIVKGNKSLLESPILWDAAPDKNGKITAPTHKNQLDNTGAIAASFVNVVTETRFASSMPNVSEKTLKPILVKRPFIMVGPVGTLAHLRELGFKTFSKWWDEGYDSITDHSKRLEMIYKIIESINDMPLDDLNTLLEDMNSVLEHNFNNMLKLGEQMGKNLD